MPVRAGVPQYSGGLSEVVRTPRFATGVGLLVAGQRQVMRMSTSRASRGPVGNALASLKGWFQGNF